MNTSPPSDLFKEVPAGQFERYRRFRETHPNKTHRVDGVAWQCIVCGRGAETLLLLPGGSRFAEVWWKLIDILEAEYRIISPSYPALATMEAHDRGLAAILAAEGVTEPVHVIGASFGGWLAQTFVRRYPQRVRSVVLSGTSGPAGASMPILRLASILNMIYPESVVRLGLKRNIMRTLAAPPEEAAFWDAFFQETLYLYTSKADARTQNAVIGDFMANYDLKPDDLNDWPGRLLIIEAADDLAFKPEAREALRRLYPQARVHTFTDTGHSPAYTRPGEFLAVLRPFLQAG